MSPEIIAGVAGVVGYVSGLALEQRAIHQVAKNQANLSEATGLAMDLDDTVQRVNLYQKVARTMLAPLVLTAGVATATEAYANAPGDLIQQTPAVLEVVIDHSGATGLDLDGKPTVITINKLATQLIDNKVNSEAFVAGSNQVRVIKTSDISADKPFGAAPLTQAMTTALSKAGQAPRPATETGSKRASGVVFITNGNSVIGQASMIADANRQQTPIFIVNVEKSSQSDQPTNLALQSMAAKTKGKYWNANETNAETIIKNVTTSLRPEDSRHTPIPDRNLLRGLGLLAGAAVVGQYVGRKNKTIGRGAKGE